MEWTSVCIKLADFTEKIWAYRRENYSLYTGVSAYQAGVGRAGLHCCYRFKVLSIGIIKKKN